jgi:glycosyltransferase involved in cell wall biosynthesis
MRTLLIAPQLPWPYERYGAAQRTELLRRSLSGFGPVDLLVVNEDGDDLRTCDPSVVAVLRARPSAQGSCWTRLPGPVGRLCTVLAHVKDTYAPCPAAAERVVGLLRERRYDLVVVRYLRTACLVAVHRIRATPTILDFDDVDWLVFDSQLSEQPWPGWRGRCGAALVRWRLHRQCVRAAAAFDSVWVTSSPDEAAVHPVRARVLPNIPFALAENEPPCPCEADSQVLLFVGLLSYAPNVRGMDRFLGCVWPAVRRAVPGASLRVVGAQLDERLRVRWGAAGGVTVVGPVDDLRPEYARAAATIAPIYQGGGTKIKVLESLALGRACVATPQAVRGHESVVRDRDMAWVGRTDEELAEGCVQLLSSHRLREQMARAGREAVEKAFSFASFQGVVAETVRSLVLQADGAPLRGTVAGERTEAQCGVR